MLGQRRRLRAVAVQMLYKCFVFAGKLIEQLLSSKLMTSRHLSHKESELKSVTYFLFNTYAFY